MHFWYVLGIGVLLAVLLPTVASSQQGECANCFKNSDTGCAMCEFMAEFGTTDCCTPACDKCDCNSVPCGPGFAMASSSLASPGFLRSLAQGIAEAHPDLGVDQKAQELRTFPTAGSGQAWDTRTVRRVLHAHGILLGSDRNLYACDGTSLAHLSALSALQDAPPAPQMVAWTIGGD
jgi:hypothetical protein